MTLELALARTRAKFIYIFTADIRSHVIPRDPGLPAGGLFARLMESCRSKDELTRFPSLLLVWSFLPGSIMIFETLERLDLELERLCKSNAESALAFGRP